MIRQIGFELYKMSRRPRSYMGFAALLAIASLMMIGAKYGGLGGEMTRHSGGTLQMSGSPVNAELMTWLVIGFPPIAGMIVVMCLPFFVCLTLGEVFATENSEGTVRTLLTRPVTRASVYASKFIASFIYTAALIGFLGVATYALGAILFGTGGLLTYGSKLIWFSQGEGLARLALGYGLTLVVMLTVGMIALFISIWLSSRQGATGGAMGLLFATLIMKELYCFRHIKPYLFGSHALVAHHAFDDPIPWHEIGGAMLCLGAYIAVLLIGSLVIFKRKDVLA